MRLLIDLFNLAYRSAYALDLSHKGQKTSVIYGVLDRLEGLLHALGPTELVICWDGGSKKRKQIYPDYKGNRKKDPVFMAELHQQLEILRDIFDVLPVVQCFEPGVEADDIIAVLCKFLHLEETGIATSDSDLFQLCKFGHYIIDPKTHVFFKPDISPQQYLIYRVLVGGKDNVPGIKQIGDVKARKLISQFQTLKKILQHSKKQNGLGKMDHKEVVRVVKRNLAIWNLQKPHVTELERKSILNQYKLGRLKLTLDTGSLKSLFLQYGFSSFLRRFSMFTGAFKRLKGVTSGKVDQESSMGQKDQSCVGWTKRIRKVEVCCSSGKTKEKGSRVTGKAGRQNTSTVFRSKEQRQHQIKKSKNGYTSRIRKIASDGSSSRSRRSSAKRAVRAVKSGTEVRTVESRRSRIDFSDQGLSPSKRVQQGRAVRRSAALRVLSVLARGEGDQWIREQSTERLKFVSELISRMAINQKAVITKGELEQLDCIYQDYLNEEPDWMKWEGNDSTTADSSLN